ncbi:MAG: outer membrane lipid asymmetry maintenance protein MlaD [Deltaproteobacteria bacterium]|nr:outer membrane lipid asymmetry maintenance protein MlaD [Deltaproteobacteria bacterium]
MNKRSVEIGVGIFVLIGLLCVGYLTIRLGRLEILGGDFYPLRARFVNVGGLKSGASVRMAGVQIGRVDKVGLNPERLVAEISMNIDPEVEIPEDSTAAINTSGLIGDKFVQVSPGGSLEPLKPGDYFQETRSAVDILDLVGKYVFGNVTDKKSKGDGP